MSFAGDLPGNCQAAWLRSSMWRRTPATARLLLAILLVLEAAAPGDPSPVHNGRATTPPMGWNDNNAYGLEVTDALIRETVDIVPTFASVWATRMAAASPDRPRYWCIQVTRCGCSSGRPMARS